MPKLRDVNKDRDPYALDMLAAVLDGHDASRFAKNLVRGQQYIGAGAENGRDTHSQQFGVVPGRYNAAADHADIFRTRLFQTINNLGHQGFMPCGLR